MHLCVFQPVLRTEKKIMTYSHGQKHMTANSNNNDFTTVILICYCNIFFCHDCIYSCKSIILFFSAGRERQPSENAQKMPEAKLGNHSKIQKQQFDDDLIKVIMMILIFVYPETTYLCDYSFWTNQTVMTLIQNLEHIMKN